MKRRALLILGSRVRGNDVALAREWREFLLILDGRSVRGNDGGFCNGLSAVMGVWVVWLVGPAPPRALTPTLSRRAGEGVVGSRCGCFCDG